MRMLIVFIAVAVLSIGISSVLAETDLIRNSISSAAGRIDYAMTYVPSTVETTDAGNTPVVNLMQTDSSSVRPLREYR